jgi:hypothetical protein
MNDETTRDTALERTKRADSTEATIATDRIQKYARPHRVAFVTACGLAAVLAVAATAGASFVARALSAERLATRQVSALKRANAELNRARREAAVQRDRARLAVDELYTHVAEKWLAQQPELAPLQREFLLKALASYQDLARDNSADPDAQAAASLATFRAASIQSKLGDYAESERTYRSGLQAAEELAVEFPWRPQFRFIAATFANGLAELLAATNRIAEAVTLNRRYLERAEALAAESPNFREYLDLVELLQRNRAKYLAQLGRRAESERAFRRASDLSEGLVVEWPTAVSHAAIRPSGAHTATRFDS